MTYIKYTVNLTPSFENELINIYKYLRFTLNLPNSAQEFYDSIIKKLYSLSQNPERFSKVFGYKTKNINLRKLQIKNYVIIYEVNNNTRSSSNLTYFSWFSKLFEFLISV